MSSIRTAHRHLLHYLLNPLRRRMGFVTGAAPPHVPPRWDHPRRAAAGVKRDGTPAASDRADDRQIPAFLRICGLTAPRLIRTEAM
jgi:hypothetical protein